MSVLNFLRQALSARKGIDLSMLELRLAIMEWMERLDMDPSFADRYLNEGFSGGEKKRNEILQMAILEPEIAILDETDSGLDIDALRGRRPGRAARSAADRPDLGILAITHYQRLLDHLEARRRAHPRRRAHRRVRRPRAGRAARSRGLRRMAADARPTRSTSPPSKADFPLLDRAGARQAASSTSTRPPPSQKPRVGARRDGRTTTRRPTPTCTAASTRSPRRPPTPLRGAPGPRSPASSDARSDRRDRLHQERHRGAQPRRATRGAGPTSPRATPSCSPSMEHHANIVPWHMLAAETRHRAPLDPARPPTATSTSPTSTACSTAPSCSASPPCRTCSAPSPRSRRLADAAHAAGALVRRRRLPVRAPPRHRRAGAGTPTSSPSPATRCCGPTGIGVLWGREELLDAMPPFLGGGEMIRDVTPRRLHHQRAARGSSRPARPPIAEAIGLGAAVDYLDGARHGRRPRATRWRSPRYALRHAHRALRRRPHASTAPPSPPSAAACSRSRSTTSTPTTSRQVLDEDGVCVRAGHHCAKPLMRVLGVAATDPGLVLRLQRRGRRRRARRRPRRSAERSSRSDPT